MATYIGTWDHDNFVGTTGADTFTEIKGGDKVDGGKGTDTISIDLSYTDIPVHYNAVAAATAYGTEPLWYMWVKNVERLGTLRTGGGDDSLTISAAQGPFQWYAGAGADTLKADYSASASGLTTYEIDGGYRLNLAQWGAATFANAYAIERVELIGSKASDYLTGMAGDDTLSGGAGNDTLDPGFSGADLVDGGAGFDMLNMRYYNETHDIVYDARAAATAAGTTLFNGTVVRNVETMSLNTGSGNDTVTATFAQKNFVWIANGGTDTLIADYSAATGALTVESVSSPLGMDLRILVAAPSGQVRADSYGIESLYLTGSKYNDVIHGTAGADTFLGGAGNDTYYVDAGDVVVELNGQGTDTIISTVTYDLAGQYIENLTLTGTDNLDAFGNSLNNTLIGNDGDNLLNGSTGKDRMVGGLGNDTYFVDNTGDVVSEAYGEGNDTIVSSISFTLARDSYIEGLILAGTANLTATGDNHANRISGNAGNNIINGGAGNDTLTGGLGADKFVFNYDSAGVSSGEDVITDFSAAQGDKLDFSAFHTKAHTVTQLGSDTLIEFESGTDIIVKNMVYNDPNFLSHIIW